MGLHRYDHSLRLPPSNFYQTSPGPYVDRCMDLHSVKGFGFLNALGTQSVCLFVALLVASFIGISLYSFLYDSEL